MGMNITKENIPAVTNPTWSTTITLADGATFDGNDSTTDTYSARLGGSWPWSRGFVIKPPNDIALGDATAAMWQDYYTNEKRGNGTAQEVDKQFTGNVWNEDIMIRFTNKTGSELTLEIGR